MEHESTQERRAGARVDAQGHATLWRLRRVCGCYELSDLSVGGCALHGGPPAETGKLYRVVIRLPGGRHAVRRPAWVTHQHQDAAGWTLGVCFLEPPAAGISLLVSRPGRVLVADSNHRRARNLAAKLTGLGCDVVQAGSQREAIWELENGSADFAAVIVDGELLGAASVLHHTQLEYPAARRLLMETDGGLRESQASDFADIRLPPFVEAVQVARVLGAASAFQPGPPTSK